LGFSKQREVKMPYEVEVRLLAITPDSETLLERAGRLCYASTDKLGTSEHWLPARIRQGHESLVEHASATFYIKASRALTHELVRHRIASYSQRSQRYVRETGMDYITPPELSEAASPDAARLFGEAMSAAWGSYRKLLEAGVSPEIARYVLPNACTTEIVCTWNFREIRHIIKLRTDPAALPEFQAVAERMKTIMKEQAPKVFGDL
jgi:thymidylate synthase (FAD)